MSYSIASADVPSFLTMAGRLGFAAVTVDLAGALDRDEAIARIAAALRFPDWFGGTWDALSDCLRDMSWWPARGYVVVVAGDALPADDREVLAQVFDEAAIAWLLEGTPFWPLFACD